MSDVKPRRLLRESGRGEIAASESVPTTIAPTIVTPAIVTKTSAVPETAPVALAIAAQPSVVVPLPSAAPAAALVAPPPAAPPIAHNVDAWSALVEAQTAFARNYQAITDEIYGMATTALAASTEAATSMLRARNFADAVEINTTLVRRSADAMMQGSTRLSEIGLKAASDASRPILSRLGSR